MPSHKPLSVWLIGLPCSGKSTLAQGVAAKLQQLNVKAKVLDGDNLRKGINNNLGFAMTDRIENIRRVAEINKLFLEEGYVVLNALICPLNEMRKLINEIVDKEFYSEIYVNAPLLVCEQRDIKGMYKKARGGEIQNFTGISSPFEPPASPDVIIRTDQLSIDSSVEQILSFVKSKITE
jgi:adenylylsulfate kinase